MTTERYPFFAETLRRLIGDGEIRLNDHVLVVCGGPGDACTLRAVGFTDVTVSNLDEYYNEGIQPYEWAHQDAEALTYVEESFDAVIVHAGLHHCRSAHRALTEMYRVARRTVVVLENSDNLLVRAAVKLGLAPEFEVEAVTCHNYEAGGLRNGPIPNYIYRWTEDEVRKTLWMYDPARNYQIRYFYGLRLPMERLARTSRWSARAFVAAVSPAVSLAQLLFPRIGNEFGFAVLKRPGLRPWLRETAEGPRVDPKWAERAKVVYR